MRTVVASSFSFEENAQRLKAFGSQNAQPAVVAGLWSLFPTLSATRGPVKFSTCDD
jgi:hypothetical protein